VAAPTNLVITFTNPTGSPQTVQIRAGTDFYSAVHNVFLNGGFWFLSSTGVQTFCPWGQITGITAQ